MYNRIKYILGVRYLVKASVFLVRLMEFYGEFIKDEIISLENFKSWHKLNCDNPQFSVIIASPAMDKLLEQSASNCAVSDSYKAQFSSRRAENLG